MVQAAAYLGLSTWTVSSMVAAGKLPLVDLGIRRVLVDRVALDAQLRVVPGGTANSTSA